MRDRPQPPSPTGSTPSPEPLEVVRARSFGSVFVLVQHLSRRTDALLAPMGLTSRQWLLLAVLSQAREPLSLSEAAIRYGSSRQNIKAIALGLERAGYLALRPDPRDGRTVRLHRTGLASRFDDPDVATAGRRLLEQVFRGLDRDELRTLDALLGRWLAAAASDLTPAPPARGHAQSSPAPRAGPSHPTNGARA